jgi:hypothetical protein
MYSYALGAARVKENYFLAALSMARAWQRAVGTSTGNCLVVEDYASTLIC